VKFPTPTFEDKDQPNEAVAQIKEQVCHAMKALEEGRHAAAFNSIFSSVMLNDCAFFGIPAGRRMTTGE
jgi:hypothetical protein